MSRTGLGTCEVLLLEPLGVVPVAFSSARGPLCLSQGAMSARRALKAVLVDLSGTLHVEDSAVPGAQEALKRQVSLFFRFPLGGCVGAVCTKGWVSGPGANMLPNPLTCVNARRTQRKVEILVSPEFCCFPRCLFLCFLSLFET